MNEDPCAGAARHWQLDPVVTFLNHGSFGACPRVVLEAQRELRDRLEAEPVRFFLDAMPRLATEARAALGALVGADPDDLALVPNATHAVNAVLRSYPLEPGDELLTTDHAYNACRNALLFAAERSGARVVVAPVPFPLEGEDDVLGPVLEAVTPRTRLALLDHVTSPTAVIFPIERLVAELQGRGVDVLVDGAHAVGMLPLDLTGLDAAYYTANAHKWLCAPKGAAFLHVRRDRQARFRPLSISHGANDPTPGVSRFRLEADWTGTDDPSPWLCIPEAIRFLSGLCPGGIEGLMARNRALAREARAILSPALGVGPPCPEAMLGSMAALPLPASAEAGGGPLRIDPLQQRLWEEKRIEVPVMRWPPVSGRLLRVSAQAYNAPEQYRELAAAIMRGRPEGSGLDA